MKPARRPVDLAQRLLPFQQAITMPARATYCVYTHSYQGKVFYIGMGQAARPFQQTGRTLLWQQYVAQITAYEVAMVFWTDDATLAREKEAWLISEYKPACNRVREHPKSLTGWASVTFTFPGEFREVLRELAYQRRTSIAQMIRDAIRTAVSERRAHSRPS